MAKREQEAAPEAPEQPIVVVPPDVRAKYARFHMPIQFVGEGGGVYSDTAKLRGAALSVSAWGLRVEHGGRTILVGWPNLHYVELV